MYYMGKKFDCDGYVTSANVTAFIAEDAAYISSVIGAKYALPVSNAGDLMILKSINEKMVAGTIDDIYREKSAEDDNRFDRLRRLRKEALDILNKIATGEITLSGTQNTSAIKFNNVDSCGNEVHKRFKDENIAPKSYPPFRPYRNGSRCD